MMVTVKFYGLFRLDSDLKELFVPAGTVREIFDAVKLKCPKLTNEQLNEAILFLNQKNLIGKARFAVQIKEGDVLSLLSPVSGG